MTASFGKRPRRVLIIVENLPVPFDRRVWSEATTLRRPGYEVSVICPKGPRAEASYRGDRRHPHLPPSAALRGRGAIGYLLEYATALFWEFVLALAGPVTRGFDAIHACNPPDLIFLIGGFFKLFFRKRFLFDQHDINPELYEAKFGRRDVGLARAQARRAADFQDRRCLDRHERNLPPDRHRARRNGPGPGVRRPLGPQPRPRSGRCRRIRLGGAAALTWSAYIGVIGGQEGIDLLLEAVEHIVRMQGPA